MKLVIIDTDKTVEYVVDWVELNTSVGNIVIQKEHAPMIVELSGGKDLLFCTQSGEIKELAVVQGVAHVTREYVKILFPLKT